MILVIGCLIVFADLQYNQMNPILNDFSVLWFVQLFISAMYTSLVQIRDEQERKETIHQLEKEKLEIGYQLKELELNTLKEQIHPHFLFNTLNNIYGLAIEKSDDLPKVLLQLSGLLDYLVYQSKEDKVALAKEVKLLQEYIALEQLRLDDRFQLNMHFEGINPEIQITPFLLFPMVENAFKHGIKKTSQSAYLNIITAFHENEFIFEVENSKPQQVEYYKSGGTGLENLKRRLNLYYPNQHQFKIIQNEAYYKAILSIQL
ncbi:sensor histidine kinase [Flammeovirga sp. OC4]|uniref:sensor histidine kinase n=1 Tax=Flammeovirga sp. OC4 TaxID=1382345 RepID=UPI0006945E8B|nr:histidine kinase [Flammeovirga sp. OC4]